MARAFGRSVAWLGILAAAISTGAARQYTISARPGMVNCLDGNVFLDDNRISEKSIKKMFLNTGDILATDAGKAEVLLTPGVFLRIGESSGVRMLSPSLVEMKVELIRGEAMLEVDQISKEDDLQLLDHGASITIRKAGLYRFSAGSPPVAGVITGRAEVSYKGRRVTVTKQREVVLSEELRSEKLDLRREDDLYAWSNIRSKYTAAASFQSARSMAASSNWGFDFGPSYAPGWLWNDAFDSWAWLPGAGLAFFSPFGYGFFSPTVVGYAPICHAQANGGPWHGRGNWVPVGVNPQHPPAIGSTPRSPWQAHMASLASSHLFAAHGFPTPAGGFVPAGMRIAGSGLGRSANGGHVYTPSAASSGFGRSGAGHWGGGGGHFGGSGGGHSVGGGFGGHSGGGGHR